MSGIADGIMFQEGDSRPLIDGMLKELFVQEGVTVNADDGTEILPIQDFRVSEPEDGLFRISCTTGSGEEISSWAALRSASGDHSGEGGSQ